MYTKTWTMSYDGPFGGKWEMSKIVLDVQNRTVREIWQQTRKGYRGTGKDNNGKKDKKGENDKNDKEDRKGAKVKQTRRIRRARRTRGVRRSSERRPSHPAGMQAFVPQRRSYPADVP